MLTAIGLARRRALSRKQPEVYSAQAVEAQDEEDEETDFLEAHEAPDDELEAEYQEAVALMTNAEQKWTKRDSSFENLSRLKIARPGSTSSNKDFRVCGADSWAIEKIMMSVQPK